MPRQGAKKTRNSAQKELQDWGIHSPRWERVTQKDSAQKEMANKSYGNSQQSAENIELEELIRNDSDE